MDEIPTVSVVVPVLNGCRTIETCLKSLLAMDYPQDRFEIVVVNNGSTDRTTEILSHFRNKVKLLTEAKRGPSAARNQGIRGSSGNAIAFMDADCVADSAWLRNLVAPLQDDSVGIVGGRILSRRPCNSIEMFGEEIHDHQKAIEVYRPPYAITMNWASPRNVFIEAGLFDESFLRCEDVNLSQRITQRGYTLMYQHGAVVYHRNEDTFHGLFREGYQHGFWAVKNHRDHCTMNAEHGHRRINMHSYKVLSFNLLAAFSGTQRMKALCQATFDIGKKCGKVVGSCRFGFIDL